MMRSKSTSFVSAAFWNAVSLAFSWLMGVATAVVIGRWLGPSGKGEYTLALLLGSLLFTLLNLGVPSSISYYLAGDRLPQSSLVKTIVCLAALLSAAAISIAVLLDRTGWCRFLFGVPRFSPAMRLAVWMLPFQFAGAFLQFVILAQGRRVLFAAIPVASQAVASLAIFALLWSGRLNALAAVGAAMASQILTAAILLVYEQRCLDWLRAPLAGRQGISSLARYSAISYLGNTFQFLVQRIDVFLVSVFLGIRAVGLYSVAYGLAELLLLLPQRLGVLYLPRIAGDRAPAGIEEVRLSASLVFFGALASALLLAVIGPLAIRFLYGEAFAAAVTPFLLLLPGVCALATSSILAAYLAGIGRVLTNTAVATAGLVLNVALNLFLIPRWGISGAAVASSVCYCAEAALLLGIVATFTSGGPLTILTAASPHFAAGLVKRTFREAIGIPGRAGPVCPLDKPV